MSLEPIYVTRCPMSLGNNVVVMLTETIEKESTDHKLVVSDVREQERTLKESNANEWWFAVACWQRDGGVYPIYT
jgi:hypothetical protein